MPEQAQRPATDEQLRGEADRAVRRWIDDTERALRDRWVTRPVDAEPLTAIVSEERRRWWAERLRDHAHDLVVRWRAAAQPAYRELVEQTFARLCALDPRPGEQDVARRTPDVQCRISDLLTGTAAAVPLVESAEAVEAAITDLVDRVATLDDVRAAKSAELVLECQAVTALLTRAQQIASGAPATGEAVDLKRLLLEPHLKARDALRLREFEVRRVGEESDRALREALDAPFLTQCRVIVARFNTARADAAAATAAMPGILTALEAAVDAFDARFGQAVTLAQAHRQVEFYGLEAFFALCSLSAREVPVALAYLQDPGEERRFRDRFPAGSPRRDLTHGFQRAAKAFLSRPEIQSHVSSAQ